MSTMNETETIDILHLLRWPYCLH